ncbi:hypothetical protein X777_08123, partial [Ooceraea biroi]
FHIDSVNSIGLIAVDSVSLSRIRLTRVDRSAIREESRANTLAAQSQPEGIWSVERMALRDVGVAGRKDGEGLAGAISYWALKNINHSYFYCAAHGDNVSLLSSL